MARVYLIKDGPVGDEHAGEAHDFPVETVAEALTPFEKRYFLNPPTIAAPEGGASEDYRHVVVKVEESETNAIFPDEGYYYVPHLTPDDGRRLLGF